MYGDYLQFAAGDLIPADPATWTTEENKVFERTLVDVPEDAPDRWWQIAAQIPGKEPEDIHLHYLLLLHDINLIDSGGVDIPLYESEYGDLWPDTSANSGSAGEGGEEERGSLVRRRTQEIFGRIGEIWKGRLEKYIEVVGEDADANTSSEPRSEVLFKAEREEREQEEEYS